jgi:hypothetical protein
VKKRYIISFAMLLLFISQGCIPRTLTKVLGYSKVDRERQAAQEEKESRLATAIADGQKDFFQISPISSNALSVEFDQFDNVYSKVFRCLL